MVVVVFDGIALAGVGDECDHSLFLTSHIPG
jgi:hypothetical protein